MGIFGKKKVDDNDNNNIHRDLVNEISDLQKKTDRQNELLQESTAKLESARSEYDIVVHDLMKIKKEINEQSQEHVRLEQMNSGIRDEIAQGKVLLRKKSKDLESAKTMADDLAQYTAKLEKTKHEYSTIKTHLAKLQIDNNTDMLQYKERLEISQAECQDLRGQMREQHEVIVKLQEQLDRARRHNMTSPSKNSTDKSVVEAASVVVASLRKKMLDAQNALAEEQARHAKTLSDLEELKK